MNESHEQSQDTQVRHRVFKRSAVVAVIVWLLTLVGLRFYTDSWGIAILLSIEVGGILAALISVGFYHLSLKLIANRK